MTDMSDAASIDAVILCGGMGTRLRPISGDLPKVLVPFAGRPFIDILIGSLLPFGFRRFILCTGYRRERLREHFAGCSYDVIFSEEDEPLGTGGAVKRAAPLIAGSSFLVVNGDSICPIDFSRFHAFHVQKGGILSLSLAKPLPGQDYGVVEMGEAQRIISFREKTSCRDGAFVSGGLYFMRRDIFDHMPPAPCFSLEYDLFPKLLPLGCYGFPTDAELIDIGTPERYLQALQRLS